MKFDSWNKVFELMTAFLLLVFLQATFSSLAGGPPRPNPSLPSLQTIRCVQTSVLPYGLRTYNFGINGGRRQSVMSIRGRYVSSSGGNCRAEVGQRFTVRGVQIVDNSTIPTRGVMSIENTQPVLCDRGFVPGVVEPFSVMAFVYDSFSDDCVAFDGRYTIEVLFDGPSLFRESVISRGTVLTSY
jgi:hypothetical protein